MLWNQEQVKETRCIVLRSRGLTALVVVSYVTLNV